MKKYWIMAAAYFGLYGFLLTVMPLIALQHGRTGVEASVLVAALAVVGFLGDLTVSGLSSRAGKSAAILIGAALIGGGIALALLFGEFIPLLIAAGVIGLGLSYIVTPVLGGLSTRAGRDQVKAQAINGVVQRAGALGLGLFLGLAVTEVSAIVAIVTVALATLMLGAVLVHREDVKREPVSATPPPAPAVATWAPVLRSDDVRRALVVNAATPVWIIAGSSLFPLILLALGRSDLLVPAIVAREVVAMIAALCVMRTRSRRILFIAWTASMAVGAAGFLFATIASGDVLIVALFALHGACIALGIVFANVLFYDGTTDDSRIIAFSLGSMSSRTAALLFPLAFAAALAISPLWAAVTTVVIVIILSLAVVAMQMRRASARSASHSKTSLRRDEVKTVDTPQGRLLIVGSINRDRTHFVEAFPAPGQTVLALREIEGLGGKGANQAVAAARSGARVVMVGNVGRDVEGDDSVQILQENGVDTSGVMRLDASTGKAFIAVSAEGENTIVVVSGANRMPLDADATDALVRTATVVAAQGEIAVEEIDRVARMAVTHGARFVLNLAPFVAAHTRSLSCADPLILNVSEAADLLQMDAADLENLEAACRAADDVRARVARSAIITLGAQGAVVAEGADVWHIPALAPVRVVDTTGAGDAFVGAVCAALSSGASLLEAAQFGSVAAGMSVAREGATQSYPSQQELLRTKLRNESQLRPSAMTSALKKEAS